MYTKKRRIGSLGLLAVIAGATVLLITQTQSQGSALDRCIGTSVNVDSAIAIVSPVGGERFRAGERQVIRWHGDPGIDAVDITLWDGEKNEWRKVAVNVPVSPGTLEWLVPHDLDGKRYRIKVANHENSDQYWMSSDYFYIEAASPFGSSIEEEDVRNLGNRLTNGISIKPVPADENIEVRLPDGYLATRLHIVDAQGERVMEIEAFAKGPTLSISTARLSSGAYILIAEDDLGTSLSCRLVVRH